MLFAAVRDTAYNIVLVLHILAVILAFAPMVAHPVLSRQAESLEPAAGQQVLGFIATNSQRIYAGALVVVGLLGFALQGMSSGAWEFGQTWFWLSILLWIAMNGILHAVVIPGERAVAAGDRTAESRVAAGGMALTLLVVVTLFLMVDKPGL